MEEKNIEGEKNSTEITQEIKHMWQNFPVSSLSEILDYVNIWKGGVFREEFRPRFRSAQQTHSLFASSPYNKMAEATDATCKLIFLSIIEFYFDKNGQSDESVR